MLFHFSLFSAETQVAHFTPRQAVGVSLDEYALTSDQYFVLNFCLLSTPNNCKSQGFSPIYLSSRAGTAHRQHKTFIQYHSTSLILYFTVVKHEASRDSA